MAPSTGAGRRLMGGLVLVVALLITGSSGRTTQALWSDPAPVTTGVFTAAPAPAPVTGLTCAAFLSVQFTWTAQPYRNYRVRVVDRDTGVPRIDWQTTTTNSQAYASTLLGSGRLRFDVVAVVPGSTWESTTVASVNFTYGLLGLGFVCNA